MHRMLRRAFVVFTLAATGSMSSAWAEEPMRVRGTVEGMDGALYVVKTRSGDTVKVALTDKPLFVAMAKVSMADIKPGMFVGATSLPQADGTLRAVEVHIFPEAMRGTGEGFRPFDLAPGSSMTNGALSARVEGVEGATLTVTYQGGSQTIHIDATTPIVGVAPGANSDLKPGAAMIARGARAADGAIEAARVIVGKDGLTPPM